VLIEFRVKNFRSFDEEQVFSLVASKDDRLQGSIRQRGEWLLLPSAAIYGPNASGKSNLIKAVRAMTTFVRFSADQGTEARNLLVPFALNQSSLSKPSSFEASFLIEGIRYQYGFTATPERVWSEWLLSYPKGRAQSWVQREYLPEQGETRWQLGRTLTGDKQQLKGKVRPDALFLSVAAQWNQEQLKPIYEFFAKRLRAVLPDSDIAQVTERLLASPLWDVHGVPMKQAIVRMLRNVDPTICDLTTETVKPDQLSFMNDLADGIRERLKAQMETTPFLSTRFQHQGEATGHRAQIPFSEESEGTKRFFELLGPWLDTLFKGYTVFVDELERSLHPLLARALVEEIHSPAFKKGGAQVIFTTHDTTLLDPELFRRDQIWFTEKNEEGATHLYSMSDYKDHRARKDEAFQKNYMVGRYGAIPIIRAFESDELEKAETKRP
jgi:AAA15 family ATPase/GTPase